MNYLLWALQATLALLFLFTGLKKLTSSREKLGQDLPWTREHSLSFARFIGGSELLIALGLILPELMHIFSWLTFLAGLSFCLIMVLASLHHIKRKEGKATQFTTLLFLLAAMVTLGRAFYPA
ncbi:MAG TPA: DoxX family protein [Flavisolibacter sp.]|nr:DoxX family protein [Flavisolibacter sp.]